MKPQYLINNRTIYHLNTNDFIIVMNKLLKIIIQVLLFSLDIAAAVNTVVIRFRVSNKANRFAERQDRTKTNPNSTA